MCDANVFHDLRGDQGPAARGGIDGQFAEAVGQLEELPKRQRDTDPGSKQQTC